MWEPEIEPMHETEDGYKIQAVIDTNPMNPRDWNDHLGTMYCAHQRYNLGDVQITDEEDFLTRLLDCYEDELGKAPWNKIQERFIVLPLYLYDHSGITMNTGGFSCPWDSGQVGYIAVSKAEIRAEWGVKRISSKLRNKIRDILIGEVSEYDAYLRGDVWGYITLDPDGNELDSVWGFVGRADGDYIPKAMEVIKAHRKEEETK